MNTLSQPASCKIYKMASYRYANKQVILALTPFLVSVVITITVMVMLTAAASPIAFSGRSGGGCFGIGTCTVTMSSAQSRIATFNQAGNQTLLQDEARAVYLGNLARRDNGIPPLRWNLQLTNSARWFSWDSTENRSDGFCGHQDTNGNYPDSRARIFGYLGGAGAENAFCGYVTPEDAIQGWMNSSGHRDNLLDTNSREVGLGYYRRESDGRGYVTQDFGSDPVYAPVVIENEALSTTTPNVNLYIYNRVTTGGFAGLGTATQMMIGNDVCFANSAWEPYTANRSWTLNSSPGWDSVNVKTRDVFGRTLTASDNIYLGANVPLDELDGAQLSTTQPQVTLYNLNGGGLPQVQFSQGWLADDTFGTFHKWWGNGESVSDPAAWGGTAYRLYPGDGESFAWVYDTTFIKDTPMMAYFRLKVNDNTSNSEVARISVNGGGTEYGPLSLRGTDFTASDQYQEFALNFTFNTDPNNPFLTFQFWRSGSADVYVDAVSIFTAPQMITSPLIWSVPGSNYRGQGVWVRYTNGSQFSSIQEAATTPASLNVSPLALTFLAARNGSLPPTATLNVIQDCSSFSWQVSQDVPWLQTQAAGNSVRVSVNQSGLNNGLYTGSVTISAVNISGVSPVSIPVQLLVVDEVFPFYLPLVSR